MIIIFIDYCSLLQSYAYPVVGGAAHAHVREHERLKKRGVTGYLEGLPYLAAALFEHVVQLEVGLGRHLVVNREHDVVHTARGTVRSVDR